MMQVSDWMFDNMDYDHHDDGPGLPPFDVLADFISGQGFALT